VSGTWQGQTKPYAYSATYWPHGGLYYYGAGNNLVPVWNYNSRLQPGCEAATIGNNPSAYVFTECPNWGAGNNNGTLQSVTVRAGRRRRARFPAIAPATPMIR
jgi:hypothetical protein